MVPGSLSSPCASLNPSLMDASTTSSSLIDLISMVLDPIPVVTLKARGRAKKCDNIGSKLKGLIESYS